MKYDFNPILYIWIRAGCGSHTISSAFNTYAAYRTVDFAMAASQNGLNNSTNDSYGTDLVLLLLYDNW
jgi:hypothetical protein